MRAELDDTRAKLADSQMDCSHMRMRLFGEKGLVLDNVGAKAAPKLNAVGGARTVAKDDEVIASLTAGTAPGGGGGADPNAGAEDRQASSRHAREQVKRLLSFVKKQLSEDLQSYKGMGEAPNAELTDTIGRQRALASKLEGALHSLTGSPMVPMPSKRLGGGGGGGGGGVAWLACAIIWRNLAPPFSRSTLIASG